MNSVDLNDDHLPFDIIYEICKWSLPVYLAVIYNRQFHEYMRSRVLELQAAHTVQEYGVYKLCGKLHRNDGPAAIVDGGDQVWSQFGKIHREDGPAFIDKKGVSFWIQFDEIHRDDGPAIINPDGSVAWYQHGQLHRDDGPAILTADGAEYWYQCGYLHRTGGPAVVHANGNREWLQDGLLHREDGPAVENVGYRSWYLKGVIQSNGDFSGRQYYGRPALRKRCVIA